MITREKIVDEIQKVPDENLDELYSIIKGFEQKNENGKPGKNVLAQLREIRISASPDFSTKASLYDVESEDGK